MATELEFEIKLPRLVKTMNHRSNYPTEGDGDKAIENYYRCSIYIPLLDGIYTDLKTRLNSNTLKLFDLRLLIPKVFLNIMASDKNITRKILQERILKIVPMFNYLWQNDDYTKDVLAGEYDLWFNMWQNQSSNIEIKVPSTAISSLMVCSKDMFPIISSLLIILSTLPVSTATAERSFSTLKLHTTISQERGPSQIEPWIRHWFNLNKLQYQKSEVWFLGMIFSERGIAPDPESVKSVIKLKIPHNTKQLQ
eukprot:XP_016659255.1 PREDICTED: uncharacterized protein LOC107883557 [Acyrthosiphon pisum]